MGPIVRLLSVGIGLATEAHAKRKANKAQLENENAQAQGVAAGPSYQRGIVAGSSNDAPPPYEEVPRLVEVSDDKTAAELVYSGKAEFTSRRGSMVSDLSSDDDDDDDDSSLDDSDSEDDDDEKLKATRSLDDEEDWQLDEAVSPPTYNEDHWRAPCDNEKLVSDVMHATSHQVKRPALPTSRLPCPVIIPGRRPGNRTRGFVRAYAPVLDDCGIDQETFMTFLDSFHKSTQASPVFNVIDMVAGIAGLVPEPFMMAVSISLQVAARTAQEVQGRYKTNTFLDRMNTELFQPHGLYAMLFKYKPRINTGNALDDVKISAESIDLNHAQAVTKYSRDPEAERSFKDKMANLRVTSGQSHGEIEMPASAPLIYPAVDAMVAADANSFKAKAQRTGAFLNDYLDRRAQAKAAQIDPNSTLVKANQDVPFGSSLADPNHPAYRGSLSTLLSGGKIAPKAERKAGRREAKQTRRSERRGSKDDRKAERRAAKSERKMMENEQRVAEGRRPRGKFARTQMAEEQRLRGMGVDEETIRKISAYDSRKHGKAERRAAKRDLRRAREKGAVKRYLKMDQVYLIIVNMPTAEEMENARQDMA